jgi:hemolysin-activating ACP:hemolysin acyltransferase/ubiquinone/menaquinone biosynthesis C-methylase UbiE
MNKSHNSDTFVKDRLGIWCQNRQGFSWMSKKIDAATIVLALLENTKYHNSITLAQFEERFLAPLSKGQAVIYYEGAEPSALITWAFLSPQDGERYIKSADTGPPSWSSGEELWFTDFVHAYVNQPPKWIFKHLRKNVFADCAKSFSRREMKSGREGFAKREWQQRQAKPKPKPVTKPINQKAHEANIYDRQHPFRALSNDRSKYDAAELEYLQKYPIPDKARVLMCGIEANSIALRAAKEVDCEIVLYDNQAAWLTSVAEVGAHGEPLLQSPQFSIQHGRWDDFPLEDGSFDMVFSFGAITRSADPEKTLQAIMRVTKPEGHIIASEMIAPNDSIDEKTLKQNGVKKPLTLAKWQAITAPFAQTVSDDGPVTGNHWAMTIKEWFHHPYTKSDESDRTPQTEGFQTRILNLKRSNAVVAKPNRAKRKQTSLVTFSGGIDSTYVLWKMLKDTDDEVIALHINITNAEGRVLIEKIRAQQIVNYLSAKYRPITYKTTTIDHRGLNWFGYDVMSVGFEVGIVATSHLMQTNRAVDRWTMAACLEEGRWPNRWKYVTDCTSATCYPHAAPPYFSLPIIAKAEQMRLMPKELLEMTWYCRHPQFTRDGYSTCNTCKTCLIVNEIMSES